MTPKAVSILGSTGSVGTNTLDVVSKHRDRFRVIALAAGKNIRLLARQVVEFRPELVSVEREDDIDSLHTLLTEEGVGIPIRYGPEGAIEVATHPKATLVISAFVGAVGLLPTLRAIAAGKDIALANKETLVMAGELMMRKAKEYGVTILPVDSEHSAIFQCLQGNERKSIRRILLTASGGPFLNRPMDTFKKITLEEALQHPNWKMGAKITIDSATMMNKGLELIEARWLFDQPVESIGVHIHPESVVHSMVEFCDGSVMAQLGVPDMRTPIAYALAYPDRLPLDVHSLDLFHYEKLTFLEPDHDRFPALHLAMEAARKGGSAPAILNAANEVANAAFRNGRSSFLGIARVVEEVLQSAEIRPVSELDLVLEADAWARRRAEEVLTKEYL